MALSGGGGDGAPRGSLAAVVPTLGARTLVASLAALRADRPGLRIRVVAQGEPTAALGARPDVDVEWIRLERPIGFAAAVNRGLAGLDAPWIAVVNDDAAVEPGWSEALLERLTADSGCAAVQGRNLLPDEPQAVIDGEGIGWNRSWQAVQVDRGAAPAATRSPREVFGVSATAALYRRDALDALRRRDGFVFEERLGSFYEDVDLAVRLRRDGWRAASVAAATARHHGSLTTGRRPLRRWAQIHGNRWLVLARLLGGSFAAARRPALGRDLRDAAAALGRGDVARLLGVLGGFGRAARRWRHFAHHRPPLVDPVVLARFGAPAIPR